MKFTRMTICEAMNDDVVADVVRQMQEHVRNIPCLVDHSIMVEEGGRMGDPCHRLAQSSGLPDVPHQQDLPTTRREHAAHANGRLRREILPEQNGTIVNLLPAENLSVFPSRLSGRHFGRYCFCYCRCGK